MSTKYIEFIKAKNKNKFSLLLSLFDDLDYDKLKALLKNKIANNYSYRNINIHICMYIYSHTHIYMYMYVYICEYIYFKKYKTSTKIFW